jgi:hypothetical protein
MLDGSLLKWLWTLWAAITVGFVAVMIWKSIVGLKEEDVVILDPAEDNLAAEQRDTVARVQRLTIWAKGFGWTSLVVLVLTCGVSLYKALHAFGG